MIPINSRKDVEAQRGTPQYAETVSWLKGSLTRKGDTQTYPEGYDRTLKPGDAGYIAPVIGDIPDDTTAIRLGFTRAEVEAM